MYNIKEYLISLSLFFLLATIGICAIGFFDDEATIFRQQFEEIVIEQAIVEAEEMKEEEEVVVESFEESEEEKAEEEIE